MKRVNLNQSHRIIAFTLVELLVVMGIIGILAALVASLSVNAVASRNKARIKTEMANLETVIESYKTKKGFYPPDNHLIQVDTRMTPLFYELSGAIYNSTAATFTPINGGDPINSATVQSVFGLGGIMNSTTDPQENPVFTHGFEPAQYAATTVGGARVYLLVCPVKPGPDMLMNTATNSINPWHYVSSNPTNNTSSYDLWADITFRGKTIRFCNWSADPITY